MNKLRNVAIKLTKKAEIKRKPTFLISTFQFLYRDN